jgi:hypothetical protein
MLPAKSLHDAKHRHKSLVRPNDTIALGTNVGLTDR